MVPGGVELEAKKTGDRVTAHLTIRSRIPSRAIVRLVPVLLGYDPIYDRQTTEADFFKSTPGSNVDEAHAGVISPLGDSDRAIVKVSIASSSPARSIYEPYSPGWPLVYTSFCIFSDYPFVVHHLFH